MFSRCSSVADSSRECPHAAHTVTGSRTAQAVDARRTLSTLGPLGVLASVAGCSGEKGSEDAAQVTRAELRMRRDAARQSRELLARYEATAAAHTALADRLARCARPRPGTPRC